MEKLKTLKDLIERGPYDIVTVDLLRQEAIKLIKHNKKVYQGYEEQLANGPLKYFFNLTEEDLK